MPIIRIDDAGDPRIADYRNVPDPELLRRRGLFVAENRLVVRALLAADRFQARSVLVTDAAFTGLQDVLGPREDTLPIYICPRSLMQPISGYDIHRGCLALGERPAPAPVGHLLASLPAATRLVVLEAITNADNVGALFRNARAFGVHAVVVGPRCCDPLYRKAIRVSIGATLQVPYAHAAPETDGAGTGAGEWTSTLVSLKESGFEIVALTPARDAVDLDDFVARPLPRRIALLAGNEGEGLTADARRTADVRVRIRMAEGVDSLNASTATGIALYRLTPRRHERPSH